MKTIWFYVYLNGMLIDEVPFDEGYTEEEVKHSLINHDGYDSSIKVVKYRSYNKD